MPRQHLKYRVIHGYQRAFRSAGSGDQTLLLIHGVGDSSRAWSPVIEQLASHYRVIAPDLLGHGLSDKPRADYSVAAFANGMRDLLAVLNVDRVTLVGHSLGGGVAAQFAYQYPDIVDRLVMVGAGGLGRGVNPALRAATLPGASLALAAVNVPGAPRVLRRIATATRSAAPGPLFADAAEVARVLSDIGRQHATHSVQRTLKNVIDQRGQIVTMLDRAYLTNVIPTLVMWGKYDWVVPSRHIHNAAAHMPQADTVLFEHSGHFPFRDEPTKFVATLRAFIDRTTPASLEWNQWKDLLRSGATSAVADSVGAPAAELA